MKLIRCQLCGADKIGPTSDRWPHGAPVTMGHHSNGKGVIVMKCHRCTGAFKLGAMQFNGLPELTASERERYLASNPQPAV